MLLKSKDFRDLNQPGYSRASPAHMNSPLQILQNIARVIIHAKFLIWSQKPLYYKLAIIFVGVLRPVKY